MKMRNKLWFVLAFVFLIALTAVMTTLNTPVVKADSWNATQVDIKDMSVYVKGELFWQGICTPSDDGNWTCETASWVGNMPSIEACENVDVQVAITGAGNDTELVANNADIRTWFRVNGETIEAQTGQFDIYGNNRYIRTMYLKMPCNVKEIKIYTMHVEVEADENLKGITEADVNFDLQRLANDLSIKSIDVTTPCVTTCSTVYANVVVKNVGNHELNDVYVRATIKELGVSGQKYIDLLVPYKEEDESISQEVQIAIQLPANVQPGTYTLQVTASSEEAQDAVESVQFTLSGQQKTTSVDVTPQVLTMDMTSGSNAVYTMIVTNNGATSQTFTVETTGLDWATAQVNPATFVLSPGESKLVSLYVTPKDDVVAGEHLFSAKVSYGNELKTVNFTANVANSNKGLDTKTILMIVGIVLAVAIIILLIVLLAQKGKTEDKAEESYY